MTEKHFNNHPPPITKQDDNERLALTIDYELFDELLENSDASEEEKKAFIDSICSIAFAFMGLGFDVHPVQQVCGQKVDLSRLLSMPLIKSNNRLLSEPFTKAANDELNETKRSKA